MRYSVSAERPRGLFGMFTRKNDLGQITEGEQCGFRAGSNEIELNLDGGVLVIKSNGEKPIRVEFGAEPFKRRPKGIEFLSPAKPEIRTGRSLVTIIPLDNEARSRLVLRAPMQRPLTFTPGEVRAMEMGIDSMRGNVKDAAQVAAREGYRVGFNKGHAQGRLIQRTQLK